MTIDELENKLIQALKRLPVLIGNEAVNFYKDNFKKQGWQGASFQPWKKRKKETKLSRGKPILYQSGALERSIQIKSSDERSVIVGTQGQIPYARIHNEGGQIIQAARSETFIRNRYKRGDRKGKFKKGVSAGHGYTYKERVINMPQRQFMGDSPVLRDNLKQVCISEIIKAIKS